MIPTLRPDFLNCFAIDSLFFEFKPNVPLVVFSPVAKAVPAAAESVIRFDAENVVTTDCTGKERNVIFFRRLSGIFSLYCRAASTWFNPMPSPIKKKIYFGPAARNGTENANNNKNNNVYFFIFPFLFAKQKLKYKI